MSKKNTPQGDKHFVRGANPDKVKQIAASSLGFVPKGLIEEEKEGLSMVEQLKLGIKRD